MRRPAGPVFILTSLLLFSCGRSGEEDSGVVAEATSAQNQQSERSERLALTPEGEQRTARTDSPAAVIDPRETAFERLRARSEASFPVDYHIGRFGPPAGAFERQLWELSHELIRDVDAGAVEVAVYDERALAAVRIAAGEPPVVRVSSSLELPGGGYSMLFRVGMGEAIIGELVLVLDGGRWYTAGIQLASASEAQAPYAPGASNPRLVW